LSPSLPPLPTNPYKIQSGTGRGDQMEALGQGESGSQNSTSIQFGRDKARDAEAAGIGGERGEE
jgi:hypothetical protein